MNTDDLDDLHDGLRTLVDEILKKHIPGAPENLSRSILEKGIRVQVKEVSPTGYWGGQGQFGNPATDASHDHALATIFISPYGDIQGTTRKASNIIVNWKALCIEAPGLATAAYGLAGQPLWVVCLGGLAIAAVFLNKADVNLRPEQAMVLYVLWNKLDKKQNHPIETADALASVNEFLAKQNRPHFNQKEFNKVISDLEKLRSLQIINDKIVLREKITLDPKSDG